MQTMDRTDAVVVGAGPNGLAAALALVRNGLTVRLIEGAEEVGGGTRTAELTLPGFFHDVCSAVHPTALASPFFKEIGLDVEWVHSPLPLSHPLDGGRSVPLFRSLEKTATALGSDGPRYQKLIDPLVKNIEDVIDDFLSPIGLIPSNPLTFARVAALGSLPASQMIGRFETEEARALLSGLAAHSIASLNAPGTAGLGMMFAAIGHAFGWPLIKGGSQEIAKDLAVQFESQGGVIETGRTVHSIDEISAPIVVCDVMPDALLRMASGRISASGRRRLRSWRTGPGVFKVDWALDGPIPWADPHSADAATVHVGGTYEEVRASEAATAAGSHSDRPFVLVAQQSLFDTGRAPNGKQTGWGYCHVPNGSEVEMTAVIEAQIERFAPGFRDLILERHVMGPTAFEAYNPNYVGGDIGGGRFGLKKVVQLGNTRPFSFGNGVFLCSAAVPPGAGVHGMCGYYAARAALAGRR